MWRFFFTAFGGEEFKGFFGGGGVVEWDEGLGRLSVEDCGVDGVIQGGGGARVMAGRFCLSGSSFSGGGFKGAGDRNCSDCLETGWQSSQNVFVL